MSSSLQDRATAAHRCRRYCRPCRRRNSSRRAQQRIEDRLVDLRRAVGRSERRNILLRASLDLRPDAGGMQAERGLEIRSAPDRARARSRASAASSSTVCVRRQMRPLVEPFRHQQLGAGADGRPLPSTSISTRTNSLRRRVDGDRAKAERPGEMHRAFEEGDVAHGQAGRHGPQSSVPWVKKCLRMRCTSSVKTGSAITSSERGRGSGTS